MILWALLKTRRLADSRELIVEKKSFCLRTKFGFCKEEFFIGGDNKDASTLTIQPGSKIVGQSGADFLVISRGSKIYAEGTAEAPIVFTASKNQKRKRGMWGGLVINGNAPINNCKVEGSVCQAEGEGATGLYGGNDPDDNSGVLKYVRVEFAGFEITPDNELNGIAFQGVGSGTEVDYIQVHMNADDGVEFFGGTVNIRHVVLTGNKDDSMDWTSGWRGMAQFVIVAQFDDQANHGIEADNLKSPMNAEPRSNPTISNMTLLGTSSQNAKGGHGILLRRGSGLSIYNSFVSGFKNACLDLDDGETFTFATGGGVVLQNVFVANCGKPFEMNDGGADPFILENFFLGMNGNRVLQDALMDGWVPRTDSPLIVEEDVTPEDLWFSVVDYVGAVRDANDRWYQNWITLERE